MISFEYQNPVRVLYGKGKVSQLSAEIRKYGTRALLVCGSSLKRSGKLAKIREELAADGIETGTVEDVIHPDLERVYEGIKKGRALQADAVIGFGGGKCIDLAKSIALGIANPEADIWDILQRKIPYDRLSALPIGAVVTIPGSGSEMDSNSEIENRKTGEHGSVGTTLLTYPAFTILDPEMAMDLSAEQIALHGSTILIQALEQYFCDEKNTPLQNGFAETICQTVIESIEQLQENPKNEEAMSSLMWSSALTTSRLLSRGKNSSWMAGPLGTPFEEICHLPYARAIALVFPKYMKVCFEDHLNLFARFGRRVCQISDPDLSDYETARKGAEHIQDFFDRMGLIHSISGCSLSDFNQAMEDYAQKGVISKEKLEEIYRLCLKED